MLGGYLFCKSSKGLQFDSTELSASAGRQVSDWTGPLSDCKKKTLADRSWPAAARRRRAPRDRSRFKAAGQARIAPQNRTTAFAWWAVAMNDRFQKPRPSVQDRFQPTAFYLAARTRMT